ncbi:hypothetical protein B0A48_00245 [Cryoendolithus antarcticus]|uniref:Fe2OG dioxygenase domain-containing protein n=1 Tax=Cryoendolithus antarcticus TaxID=1507870 RepID=A0A1V8TU72_9PEZI|nr:hypothetical protein B0A48_00245 [Cryoendolithus antarcticus]
MSAFSAAIPIIDISSSNPNAPAQLLSAASTHGFVFVKNDGSTGLTSQSIDHVFDLSKAFFAAPVEEKESVSIASNKAGANHGWLSQGVEKLDPATQKRADVKEAFNLALPVANGTYPQAIPATLEPHIPLLIAFQESCHALCQRLLARFATALSIPPDWFTSRHDFSKGPSGTVFRLLYYPVLEAHEPDVDIRAGAHSDFGSLTLLFQRPGQPGLEIRTAGGEWTSVPVDPRTTSSASGKAEGLPILVNIGDLLEDWTAGLLKSTVHRVVFPKEGRGEDRYSIAYFCHPLDDARLEPVPSELVRRHAEVHGRTGRGERMVTAKDHLMERLRSTYSVGKTVEEVGGS